MFLFRNLGFWAICLTLAVIRTAQTSPPAGKAPKTVENNNQAGNDCYGDRLTPGSLARMGSVRLRHGGETSLVACSMQASSSRLEQLARKGEGQRSAYLGVQQSDCDGITFKASDADREHSLAVPLREQHNSSLPRRIAKRYRSDVCYLYIDEVADDFIQVSHMLLEPEIQKRAAQPVPSLVESALDCG